MSEDSILWRRLDTPGHDACRLTRTGDSWQIDGAAVFRDETGPARLSYNVTCDRAWRSQRGTVVGWIGSRRVDVAITRGAEGDWTVDGRPVPGLSGCVDLDLGFTPATNLLQLRRLNLSVGLAAEVPVAWLDVTTGALDLLVQTYERRSATVYYYQAIRFGYAAALEVNPPGFVVQYPGLWQVE